MKKMEEERKIYKIKHHPPSNQAIRMVRTKFKTQEGRNQNMRFLKGKRSYSP
jgi:hypothetical protein